MFGILFSWFIDQWATQSAVQKHKHCLTWDFLSAQCDFICCSHHPLLYANHFLSSVTAKFLPTVLSDMSTGIWLSLVHSPACSGHYANKHAWSVKQGILRTPLPCLKTNRKMRLVLLHGAAVQLLPDIMQHTPLRTTTSTKRFREHV